MKLMTLFLTVILTVTSPLVRAQTDDLRVSWACRGNHTPAAREYLCYADCFDSDSNVVGPATPNQFTCRAEHVGPLGVSTDGPFRAECRDYVELVVQAQCIFPSSGQSNSGNSTNKALIAGGVVVAGVALWNFLQPEIPVEGLEIQPKANFAYRDGFPSSSFSLQGEYGNWAFSASSVHTGKQWTKPYARAQWAWVF